MFWARLVVFVVMGPLLVGMGLFSIHVWRTETEWIPLLITEAIILALFLCGVLGVLAAVFS